MKKFLLVLMIACMYKTSVYAMYNHPMYQAAESGTPQMIFDNYPNPACAEVKIVNASLPISKKNVNRIKEEFENELQKEKSQDSLAQRQLQPNKLINHLITLALIKLSANKAYSWHGDSKKRITEKTTVLPLIRAAIDEQDYDKLARTLQINKAYRLFLYEKIQLIEHARAYEFLNDLKTKRSIKLKCKHSDEDLKPDPRIASADETSKHIVQLLQVKLYRNIKTN